MADIVGYPKNSLFGIRSPQNCGMWREITSVQFWSLTYNKLIYKENIVGPPLNFRSPLKFRSPPKFQFFEGDPQIFWPEIFRSPPKKGGADTMFSNYFTTFYDILRWFYDFLQQFTATKMS